MNKAELIAAMAAKTGDTKKAAEASVNAFVEVVTESLTKGDKVQLVGFGSFEVRKRAARKGRNPQTKEEIKIPASKSPVSMPRHMPASPALMRALTKNHNTRIS